MDTIESTRPKMTLCEERELLARYQSGNEQTRDEIRTLFIQTYGSCILKWAWRYEKKLGLGAAIATALEWFLLSLDKVNLKRTKKARLTTIAYYWVRNGLIRTNLKEGFEIRIPVHVYEQLKKIPLDDVCVSDLRRGCSDRSEKEQQMLLTLFQKPISIDGLGSSLDGMLPHEPEQSLANLEKGIDVRKAIDDLPDNLRSVMHGYYYRSLTLESLAKELGVSRTTVQNYIEQATQILRTVLLEYA